MKRLPLLFVIILLTGCDHHKPANQAQTEAGTAAIAQDDSDLTGQPHQSESSEKTKPKPVSPPPATPSTADNPPPATTSPPAATPTPAPSTADNSSPEATASPPVSSTPTPTSKSTTPSSDPSASAKEETQVVVIQTSLGRIIIELDDFAAPKTCQNFRKLVSDGFYNHTAFHRVIPNFIVQGGDPNSKTDDRSTYGLGGPGYVVPAEIKLKHDRGAVAMARLPDSVNPQRESNGSQFYICVAPCPSLDDQYTVFGHVIKGMNVATEIADQSRDQRDDPLNRIEMEASLESKEKALADGSTVDP